MALESASTTISTSDTGLELKQCRLCTVDTIFSLTIISEELQDGHLSGARRFGSEENRGSLLQRLDHLLLFAPFPRWTSSHSYSESPRSSASSLSYPEERHRDEHRRGEIAVAEHHGDVLQVRANRLSVGFVGGIVHAHFNRTTIRDQAEVMCRLVVREAHCLIAATLDYCVVGRVLLVHWAIFHRVILPRLLR